MAIHLSLHALSSPLEISPFQMCTFFMCLFFHVSQYITFLLWKVFDIPFLHAIQPYKEYSVFKSCKYLLLIIFFGLQHQSVIMRFTRSKGLRLYKQCGLPEHSVPYIAQKLPIRTQIKKTQDLGHSKKSPNLSSHKTK